MSAIKRVLASIANRLKGLRTDMTKEQVLAECERMRKMLEFKGYSYMKKAKEFEEKAAQFLRMGHRDLAEAQMVPCLEYEREGKSLLIIATYLQRYELAISRATTIHELSQLNARMTSFIDELIGEMPDNPMLITRQLEAGLTVLDRVLGLPTEVAVPEEYEEAVRERLAALEERMRAGETVPEAPMPEEEIAPPAPEARTEEMKREVEERVKKLEERMKKLMELGRAGERA